MVVDDHAVSALKTWYDLGYEELKKEWISGQYERLAECPSFKVTAAYREAMNVLIKGCTSLDVIEEQLKGDLDDEIHLETFWKETKE